MLKMVADEWIFRLEHNVQSSVQYDDDTGQMYVLLMQFVPSVQLQSHPNGSSHVITFEDACKSTMFGLMIMIVITEVMSWNEGKTAML